MEMGKGSGPQGHVLMLTANLMPLELSGVRISGHQSFNSWTRGVVYGNLPATFLPSLNNHGVSEPLNRHCLLIH